MPQVAFWICLNGEVIPSPTVDTSLPLAVLFKRLLEDPATASEIPSDVKFKDCKFHKLSPPLPSFDNLAALRDTCLDNRDRWDPVDSASLVRNLASDDCLSYDYLCLVIETPQVPHANAIKGLSENHQTLFRCLQIHVGNIKSWSMSDVQRNMNGGTFWHHGVQPEEMAMRNFDAAWRREFDDEQNNTFSTFAKALELICESIPEAFNRYFQKGSSEVKGLTELNAVQSLHDSYHRFKFISENPSSHLIGSVLGSFFFQAPFHYCQDTCHSTVYQIEFPWGFPIFIATRSEPSNWSKFTPSTDYSVTVKDFLVPFMLCEVISDSQETDRYRMLLQGIAAVRAANALKKPGSTKDLFVVAVYLKGNLTAECYTIMQTIGKVHIAQRDYNLLEFTEALDFLKAMFNLQNEIDAFAEELDGSLAQMSSLSNIADIARPMTTLTHQRETTGRTGGTTFSSIAEDTEQLGQRRGGQSQFTDDPVIQDHLSRMHYRVDAFLPGFPHVAMISSELDPLKRGILKFTKRQSEVEILQYLSKLTCEVNHTIPCVQVWTLPPEGFVIYSSFGGSHLTNLRTPDAHMWSTARQLAEGVAFMHSQGVAHLDIKPANILIHPDSGRLSIIDYSVSQLIKSGTKLHAVRGTEDYIAPEVTVKHPEYDPIRADLWSCGKTLQEFVACCRRPTREKALLVSVIGRLMAGDPLARPMMSEVSEQMIAFKSRVVKRPRPALFTPPGRMELHHPAKVVPRRKSMERA